MLLSLIKPDSGTIEIDGTIQIIFQHPETSLDPAKKIGYSLEEPMIIHKMYDKDGRKKRVKELLDLVDLGEELLDPLSTPDQRRRGTAHHDRQGSLPGSKDPDPGRAYQHAGCLRASPGHDTLKGGSRKNWVSATCSSPTTSMWSAGSAMRSRSWKKENSWRPAGRRM